MKLCEKIVDLSVAHGVIKKEESEVYTVAMSLLMFSSLIWGTLLVMSYLFHQVMGGLVFMFFHLPLRIFAGGFHQDTRTKCFIFSLIVFSVLLLGAGLPLKGWIIKNCIILVVAACIAIWCFAPVETANKPLTVQEHKKYRFIACAISVLELMVIFYMKVNGNNDVLYYSSMSFLLTFIQIISGVLSNKILIKQQGQGFL